MSARRFESTEPGRAVFVDRGEAFSSSSWSSRPPKCEFDGVRRRVRLRGRRRASGRVAVSSSVAVEAEWMEPVADATGASRRGLAVAADVDRDRPVDGLREAAGAVEVEEASVERRLVLTPQHPHDARCTRRHVRRASTGRCPIASSSSRSQPTPTPMTRRPPDRRSRVASRFASCDGMVFGQHERARSEPSVRRARRRRTRGGRAGRGCRHGPATSCGRSRCTGIGSCSRRGRPCARRRTSTRSRTPLRCVANAVIHSGSAVTPVR